MEKRKKLNSHLFLMTFLFLLWKFHLFIHHILIIAIYHLLPPLTLWPAPCLLLLLLLLISLSNSVVGILYGLVFLLFSYSYLEPNTFHTEVLSLNYAMWSITKPNFPQVPHKLNEVHLRNPKLLIHDELYDRKLFYLRDKCLSYLSSHIV